MSDFTYTSIPEADRKSVVGLIVLQSDETVEPELHQWLPPTEFDVLVSRVPSGEEVTQETLGEMADHITRSASLYPRSTSFDVVAYCCTSGTSVIGSQRVTELVKAGCQTRHVTNPLDALVSTCKQQDIKRLAFLSPYVESVSRQLREVIADHGVECPVFGSFNEGEETKVAWIDEGSIRDAAKTLAGQGDVDAVFLSCTNLKTLGFRDALETEIGIPVLSSNFVLAEEIKRLMIGA